MLSSRVQDSPRLHMREVVAAGPEDGGGSLTTIAAADMSVVSVEKLW